MIITNTVECEKWNKNRMKINTTIIRMHIDSCAYPQIKFDFLTTNKNQII